MLLIAGAPMIHSRGLLLDLRHHAFDEIRWQNKFVERYEQLEG